MDTTTASEALISEITIGLETTLDLCGSNPHEGEFSFTLADMIDQDEDTLIARFGTDTATDLIEGRISGEVNLSQEGDGWNEPRFTYAHGTFEIDFSGALVVTGFLSSDDGVFDWAGALPV